jgi:dTDP-glucose 4,6-dehydratase
MRAYFHTYGMDVTTSNCSNNYGPKQHNEKLIPVIIRKALEGENIPIYGDGKKPKNSGSYKDQIVFVQDRAGHDRRYAIDATKIEYELGWKADEDFESGIIKTVDWYLNNLKK